MAHWIITDQGFGGSFYRCSDCEAVFWDILEDVCGEDHCPRCRAPIDEEEEDDRVSR